MAEYTANVDAVGTLRILDAIRSCNFAHKIKFYQASTSELFGKVVETPQKETTPFYPRSPYGVAKQFAYWIVVNYREAYGLYACNGILFNHESPIRGPTFVTRKITRAVARIKRGLTKTLYLGNIESKRDWGHAKEYVYAMYLMLQQENPDDYVVATGEAHSVREFIELAFGYVDITIEWRGTGVQEIGINKATGETIVAIDSNYFRPTEVDLLLGDPSKAKKVLKWESKLPFKDLVKEMVESDLALVDKGDQHS